MRRALAIASVACALAAAATPAWAHDARPAFFQLTEGADGRCEVVWTVPVVEGDLLDVGLRLPDAWTVDGPVVRRAGDDATTHRWWVRLGATPLDGAVVVFPRLAASGARVLTRVAHRDGRVRQLLVGGATEQLVIAASASAAEVAGLYTWLGVEHIWFGIDHLLFVLGLLLLVRGRRLLLWTITGFTLAHSVTLALAVLGVVHVPLAPVEAVIALSIVFLAWELTRPEGDPPSLSRRRPWLIAATFGLLHGFGFAGALSAVGLPEGEIPLALAFFNVGVELGQVAFVAAAGVVIVAVRRLPWSRPAWSERVVPYAIGSCAAFWCIQRTIAIVA